MYVVFQDVCWVVFLSQSFDQFCRFYKQEHFKLDNFLFDTSCIFFVKQPNIYLKY